MELKSKDFPEWFRAPAAFLLGGLLGSVLVYQLDHLFSGPQSYRLEKRSISGNHVWPLLQCAHPHSSFQDLALKDEVEGELLKLSKEKDVVISLYTKSYPDGLWYGFNENEPIRMGSLFKVISLMNYLKQGEDKQGILDQKITFNESALLQFYRVQGIEPKRKLELGKSYTIHELLSLMVIYSDNVASILLEKLDQKASFKRMAIDLDIPIYEKSPPFRPITVQEMSSFFQILFNGSFLSKENSEYALNLLAKIDFQGGVREGIPANVTVAHKFGEALKNGMHFFNDCGIVYRPQRPFLLCVSLKAKEDKELPAIASKIAKMVYEVH